MKTKRRKKYNKKSYRKKTFRKKDYKKKTFKKKKFVNFKGKGLNFFKEKAPYAITVNPLQLDIKKYLLNVSLYDVVNQEVESIFNDERANSGNFGQFSKKKEFPKIIQLPDKPPLIKNIEIKIIVSIQFGDHYQPTARIDNTQINFYKDANNFFTKPVIGSRQDFYDDVSNKLATLISAPTRSMHTKNTPTISYYI